MIISNQMRCHSCGDEPFSAHVHDMRYCQCGNIAVDGGTEYLRRLAKEGASYTELSIAIKNDAFTTIRQQLEEYMDDDILDAGNMALLTLTMLEENAIRPIITPTVDIYKVRQAAREGAFWAINTGRNGFGLLSAVMRYVRDAGSGWEGEGTEVD